MTSETLLYRQIHPNFRQNGNVSSQAFRPTPKDEQKLSAYDGDRIDAQATWQHYTGILGFSSCGVLSIKQAECESESLAVIADGVPFPEHCSVDFSPHSKSDIEKIAKRLRNIAVQRGWRYQASV